MTAYFQKKFALSEQGAKDLVKAVFACTLTDVILMLPIGLLYLVATELVSPLIGGDAPAPSLWFYIGGSVIILALIFIFEYIQYNKTFLASYAESTNMRIRLAEKLRRLPLSFFGKRDLSDLTTTIMADCAAMETAFSHYIPEFIGAVASVILAGIGLFVMDWRMALALLWVLPVVLLIMALSRAQQNKVGRQHNKVKLDCADSIQECIETVREIKANNQSGRYLKKIDGLLGRNEKIQIRAELNTAMYVVTSQMLLRVGIATVVLVGSVLLVSGQTDFLTFLVFLIAATRVFDPLSGALINLAAIYATMLTVERMKEIEEQPVQEGSEQADYQGYDIAFDQVGFAYNSGETVLEDVSFTACQGQVTALVGPSGGGKSTAAKLAARFWDIQKGRITVGGTDISTVEPETLLKNFSIVFQDVVLFNNTILENIRIGRRNATDEEVLAAAHAAQCDAFVMKMPDGYQTKIGENGSFLSGGERQRISIARALLKDAPVILLDEATASLDVENESQIQRAISSLVKNKTVLIIAHRMRTVAGADKVVVLENGRVAQQGTPEALMEQGGLYRHMVELQQQSEDWAI